MTRPTLILLHGLGLSARFWDGLVAALGDEAECVALDLPGFGAARDASALTVEAMVDGLLDVVRARAPDTWLLVGHSMGGKLATLAAARVEAGEPGVAGLAGVVLLAASPPAPEPMDEDQRAAMIGWFADGPPSEETAQGFVEDNIAGPLGEAAMRQAVADVRRSSPAAWIGWLERGSREDWRDVVGVLRTPALIVAGSEDGDLGEDGQRRLNLPHYADGPVEIVEHAAHMLPLEQPAAVATLIRAHAARAAAPLPIETERLIRSDRTSARTRRVLLDRLRAPDEATLFDPAQTALLAAMVGRILPGCGDASEIARRLDAALAAGVGDGWRFAALPADAEAWRRGLDTLAQLAGDFAALPAERQDEWLGRMADGSVGIETGADRLSPAQMKYWFEDVCTEAARTWLSHPAAMARIGYDGFANGGDGVRKQGYARLGAGEREAWQPALSGGDTR